MSFVFDDPKEILAKIREKRPAKIADIAERPDSSKISNFSNLSSSVSHSLRYQIEELTQKRLFLMEQYQACLNVRKYPEYKTFSEITLKAEAEALSRLQNQIQEINDQLGILIDRNSLLPEP